MDLTRSFDAAQVRLRAHWRSCRMHEFLARIGPPPDATVLDVGGSVDIWELVDHRLHMTLFNTDEAHAWGFGLPRGNDARYRVVTGDACDLSCFDDASFDIVFSNSVIEHIGDDRRVRRFAGEVRRVGRAYWVQTPSWLCPVEPHTSLPFYWLYPGPARAAIARRFDRRHAQNPWSCPMAETRAFRLAELRALFPDAVVFTERVAGLTKSWSLYRARRGRPC